MTPCSNGRCWSKMNSTLISPALSCCTQWSAAHMRTKKCDSRSSDSVCFDPGYWSNLVDMNCQVPCGSAISVGAGVYEQPLTVRGPSRLSVTATPRHRSQSFNLPSSSRPIIIFPRLTSLWKRLASENVDLHAAQPSISVRELNQDSVVPTFQRVQNNQDNMLRVCEFSERSAELSLHQPIVDVPL